MDSIVFLLNTLTYNFENRQYCPQEIAETYFLFWGPWTAGMYIYYRFDFLFCFSESASRHRPKYYIPMDLPMEPLLLYEEGLLDFVESYPHMFTLYEEGPLQLQPQPATLNTAHQSVPPAKPIPSAAENEVFEFLFFMRVGWSTSAQ